MRLVLHIGTEKTGTTSIQKWGSLNRNQLISKGFYYSRALGESNHLKIYLFALEVDALDAGFSHINARTQEERREFHSTLPIDLAAEVSYAQQMGCHTFIVSNEHCHSRLTSLDQVTKLHSLVSPLFSHVTVLCLLRPQIDLAVSWASTASRVLRAVHSKFFDSVTPANTFYNFENLFYRWSSVFGRENVILRSFNTPGDSISKFCDFLNINSGDLKVPSRSNEAVDVRVMALMNVLIESRRENLGQLPRLPIDFLPCIERLQPGEDLARAVQDRFRASNAALLAEIETLDAAALDPDWSRYEAPSNLELLDQPCVFGDQVSDLLIVMSERLLLANAMQRIAEAERAMSRLRPDRAALFIADARRKLDMISPESLVVSEVHQLESQLTNLALEVDESHERRGIASSPKLEAAARKQ